MLIMPESAPASTAAVDLVKEVFELALADKPVASSSAVA